MPRSHYGVCLVHKLPLFLSALFLLLVLSHVHRRPLSIFTGRLQCNRWAPIFHHNGQIGFSRLPSCLAFCSRNAVAVFNKYPDMKKWPVGSHISNPLMCPEIDRNSWNPSSRCTFEGCPASSILSFMVGCTVHTACLDERGTVGVMDLSGGELRLTWWSACYLSCFGCWSKWSLFRFLHQNLWFGWVFLKWIRWHSWVPT